MHENWRIAMPGKIIYFVSQILIYAMRKIGWWRWQVEGLEHLPPREQTGMILVMNHIHWIDIPVVGALLPFAYRLSWLGKAELFEKSTWRWFFRTMQVIPIKRGRGDLAALETATEALRAGAILLIFPEGHRSRNGLLQKGRGGAVRLAMRSQVPLVPVAVTGTQRGLGDTLRGKPVKLRIGKPYRVEPTPDGKIPPDLMDHLTTEMMLRIAALLPAEYRGVYADQQQPPVKQPLTAAVSSAAESE
jgi:1-acyl-sn-glycerol-3-phosphate acyltransferase